MAQSNVTRHPSLGFVEALHTLELNHLIDIPQLVLLPGPFDTSPLLDIIWGIKLSSENVHDSNVMPSIDVPCSLKLHLGAQSSHAVIVCLACYGAASNAPLKRLTATGQDANQIPYLIALLRKQLLDHHSQVKWDNIEICIAVSHLAVKHPQVAVAGSITDHAHFLRKYASSENNILLSILPPGEEIPSNVQQGLDQYDAELKRSLIAHLGGAEIGSPSAHMTWDILKSAFSCSVNELGKCPLSEVLGCIFFKSVQEATPKLITSIKDRRYQIKIHLDRLSQPRTFPRDCRSFLLELTTRHHTLLWDALRGIYTDSFFNDRYSRKLRQVLDELAASFELALLKQSGIVPKASQNLGGASPLIGLYDLPTDEFDNVDSVGASHTTKSPARTRACWRGVALKYIGLVTDAAKLFMEESLTHLLGVEDEKTWTGIMINLVDPFLDAKQQEMEEKLSEVLHFYSTPRGEQVLSAGGTERHLRTFIDNVIILVLENILMEQLPLILIPETVCSLDDEMLLCLAATTADLQNERERLQQELKALDSAMTFCQRYQQRIPTRLPAILTQCRPGADIPFDQPSPAPLPVQSKDTAEEQSSSSENPTSTCSFGPASDPNTPLESVNSDENLDPAPDGETFHSVPDAASSPAADVTNSNWPPSNLQPFSPPPIAFGTPNVIRRPKLTAFVPSTGGFARYSTPAGRKSPFAELPNSAEASLSTSPLSFSTIPESKTPSKHPRLISGAVYMKFETPN
ncbi:hypothetical protein DL766_001140 [Monosporascus sp. MC13-8B]|uniref:GED domain-containing protein n=1 Tax=Monosporascus cannonballus TaxID=155416 RepID=A0ABY0HCR8_9PEZI|nr:hypothetical protein DL762_002726 [Monosporascus cannonballus]RYO97642.1 hypothetical protein DL763_002619 [Monosporascus cannonballus]RYP38061.1 hypothetical protein DL766_001140 [Monosporascus sp. MC13-8B]